MSTTPAPITTIERDITWIKGHAIIALLTVALIAGSIIGGIALFEHFIDAHDARVAAQQDTKAAAAAQTQATILAQLQQEHAENTARDAQQAALIQSLVSQMAQTRAATARQIQTDATLDIKQAAQRLAAQTKSENGDVGIQNDLVTMTLPLTRIVVANLDQLAQAQSDVTNLEGQLDAQKILTSDAKVELSTATNVIAADKTELLTRIDADNAACQVRIDKQAAKDRKRSAILAVITYIAGLATRSLI